MLDLWYPLQNASEDITKTSGGGGGGFPLGDTHLGPQVFEGGGRDDGEEHEGDVRVVTHRVRLLADLVVVLLAGGIP